MAAAFQLLQAMWNKDYQVCVQSYPPRHACCGKFVSGLVQLRLGLQASTFWELFPLPAPPLLVHAFCRA